MPKNNSLNKILVIGSGPIIIGQAAEFDYAGTQACKALKEDGFEVILVNSNPATIMTDDNIADRVYIQPLTVNALNYIIEKERPDGLLPTMGGQTGLNLAIELQEAGILDKFNVKLLGTSLDTIRKAEDRQCFKKLMEEMRKLGPKIVVITDGINGAYAHDGENHYFMPVYPHEPFERTGAGDAFSSTFVTGLAMGKSIEEALMMAPINSMSVVQKIGAQAGLLTMTQLEEYLKKAPVSYKPSKIN